MEIYTGQDFRLSLSDGDYQDIREIVIGTIIIGTENIPTFESSSSRWICHFLYDSMTQLEPVDRRVRSRRYAIVSCYLYSTDASW